MVLLAVERGICDAGVSYGDDSCGRQQRAELMFSLS